MQTTTVPFTNTSQTIRRTTLLFVAALLLGFLWNTGFAHAVRLKDLASVKGVRNNQLVGYGIVVGLNGTGDGNKAAFTGQGLTNMLNNLGVKADPEATKVKNIASVMVTATLPPFFKVGQRIDVTISSVGDATSLQGGTLLVTPLKGLDNNVYAMAQGPISTGADPAARGAAKQANHLTVARITNGASVEREVPVNFANKESITISLAAPDFTTISLMKTAIDAYLGGAYATARDGASVDVAVPPKFKAQEVALLAALENIEINPERRARVVLNERTGTVVMGDNVTISQMALSHGNLSLQVKPPPQPGAAANAPVDTAKVGQKVVTLQPGVTLGEVVRALNSVGVAPRELIAIFQAIKAAGALQAELEII
ncbi:flagellar basal body P-ring protein FlgI [Thiovibrio frasassiensis]|uniref:Flagellar P-ring protein n=1 Tax=Thiovibrio frasassiensis TaxID=2984131 RepID=A0A9X4RLK8_9BACT|nr:flagellar basal body P-ring protein FlgI [Thiovibrio frasassiensis]MDG4475839.1 flagellar basal body P-ring protein FlgI [Thiovibrio frasassiensis]